MKFLPKKLRDANALKKIADGYKEQFAAADKLTDPADRIEAMLALKDSLSDHASDAFYAMSMRSSSIEFATLFPTIVGSVLGGVALSVAGMPFVGIPLLLAGVGGGFYGIARGGVSDKLLSGMQKDMADHFGALNDVAAKTNADIDQLLKTRSNEIAASDKFGSIYDRYPGVRDSFIKTFNQAVARRELPAPPPPRPGGSSGPGLSL